MSLQIFWLQKYCCILPSAIRVLVAQWCGFNFRIGFWNGKKLLKHNN